MFTNFTDSKQLLKPNTGKYEYLTTSDDILNIYNLIIYYETDNVDEIIDILDNAKNCRKINLFSGKNGHFIQFQITKYYTNIFKELVVYAKIDKATREEIENSNGVKIDIMISHNFKSIYNQNIKFIDISVYT